MKAGDAGRDVEKRTSPVKVASTTVVPKDEMHSAASAARAKHVDAPPIFKNNTRSSRRALRPTRQVAVIKPLGTFIEADSFWVRR